MVVVAETVNGAGRAVLLNPERSITAMPTAGTVARAEGAAVRYACCGRSRV
jgi:hypothetical protein